MYFSGRLHQVLKVPIIVYYLYFCQLSLKEETREPGENHQLSVVLTNSSHVPHNTFSTNTGLTIYVQQFMLRRQNHLELFKFKLK